MSIYDMRIAGRVNRDAINYGKGLAVPGVSLKEIDKEIEGFIRSHNGCTPAFLGYMGFKHSACLSINNIAVHGVPTDYRLRKNDLLTIDLGTIFNGFYADAAETFLVDPDNRCPVTAQRVIAACDCILHEQLYILKPGMSLLDIALVGENAARHSKIHLIPSLGGHKIGKNLHMEPFIPNCLDYSRGQLSVDLQKKKYDAYKLKEGDTLCIEPVVTYGPTDLTILEDGWSCATKELSAHFEHTILITKTGAEILS